MSLFLLGLLLLPFQGEPAPAPEIAVHAGLLYVDPETSPLENAWLLIGEGRVVGVVEEKSLLPPLIPVLDFSDQVLVPGFVAADSRWTGSNSQGDHALGAHRRALDDFDSWQDTSAVLARGITTVYLPPDRKRLVGGRGAIVKTAGNHRVLRELASLHINLTVEARNPPAFFRPPIPPTAESPLRPSQVQPSSSLAGALMVLREQPGLADGSAHAEALRAYLNEKHTSLRLRAEHAEETLGALEILRAWKRPVGVLEIPSMEGVDWRALLRARIGVVLRMPVFQQAPDLGPSWELPTESLAGMVPPALVPGPHAPWTWLREAAAVAVGRGMSETSALSGITKMPAAALGLMNQVGSLNDGCDADFLVMTGAPLAPSSSILEVWIEGERVFDRATWDRADETPPATILRAGTVWTGSGPPLEGGAEVLLLGQRIVAVGKRVPHPAGARVVDAGPDAHLTPGFIDARGHLGLAARENPSATTLLGRLAASSYWNPQWLQVARAGVTTVVPAPSSFAKNGSRTQAMKTAAQGVEGAWLDGQDIVFFDVRGGDHVSRPGSLESMLKRGKKYADTWQEWRKKRAEWETEQAEKKTTERQETEATLRKRLAGNPAVEEEKEEEKETKEEEEEDDVVAEVDPINGLWEATIEHVMLPEPVNINFRVHHEGERAIILLSSPDFPDEPAEEVEAEWDGKELTIEMQTEIGMVRVVGVVDSPDHMEVSIVLSGLGSVDFEAFRIEVGEAGADIAVARKAKPKDEGPQAPSVDHGQEGLRALFEGRAVAVVAADREDEIRVAIAAFTQHELPVNILNGSAVLEVADLLRAHDVGVIAPQSLVTRDRNRDRVRAAELQAEGLNIAFQSGGAGSARFLPATVAAAVSQGLGADAALEAMTFGAARLLGLESRIGRLAPGLDADVVVLNGPPFDLRSRVLRVFVNGVEVPRD